MITQKTLKKLFLYSKHTGIFTRIGFLNQMYKRRLLGKRAGYVQKNKLGTYYRIITINSIGYKEHTLAHIYVNGVKPPEEVDHINGNGLDNRWKNLRAVTKGTNQRNRKLNTNNKTKIPGVFIQGVYKDRWRVSISSKYLGTFLSFFEACCARKSAEIKYNYHYNHGRKQEF